MIIYAIDVVELTGRSYKTALRILNEVRVFYAKPPRAFVSYREFAMYMGLDENEVLEFINGGKSEKK
ncbi:hypothetical protein HX004_13855 [Myroides sp. 1354]|nr:hypothetical protein [Myroides sp. R163-1]MDM1056848.1 hypothetical protein [Myroides sp. 1354]MDM1069881.1 hypothetical protein [Myroides sp. 1372]